jgi:hypothetical protein
MQTLPTDPQAAYRAGQLAAYGKLLADARATARAIQAEIDRLTAFTPTSPEPLPHRTPNFPQLPPGPQGGEVR